MAIFQIGEKLIFSGIGSIDTKNSFLIKWENLIPDNCKNVIKANGNNIFEAVIIDNSARISDSSTNLAQYYMNAVHNAAVACNELYESRSRRLLISPVQNIK